MRELPNFRDPLQNFFFDGLSRSVPSSYIKGLETCTTAKTDFLWEQKLLAPKAQSTLYNNQSLYIKALLNQLPQDLVLGTSSRSVLMHPPTTISHQVARQGPFLLQPSPRTLEGSESGDATDIVYLTFGADDEDEGNGETEKLGVVLLAYQDGRVDVCLDVEKVEARWETKSVRDKWIRRPLVKTAHSFWWSIGYES